MSEVNKPGKKLLDDIKQKEKQRKKKEKSMKKLNLNPKNWVSHDTLIVAKTLMVIAMIIGLVYSGWFLNESYDAHIDKQVKHEAAQMVTLLEVKPSKQ